MKKCCCFRCHFEVKILTRFGIFCRFRSLYTYNGYNKFDWLTLILRSNWTCRIWFGILSSRAFCIVVSECVYLLPFSNNCPLKHSKNIHWAYIRINSVHNKALINHHVHLISLQTKMFVSILNKNRPVELQSRQRLWLDFVAAGGIRVSQTHVFFFVCVLLSTPSIQSWHNGLHQVPCSKVFLFLL